MFALIKLLRPHQWIKNGFVLSGIIFAHLWSDLVLLKQALQLTLAFCLLSSALYIVNDFFDQTNDRNHPLKKNRPLAAGTISNTQALCLSGLLMISAITIGFMTTDLAPVFLIAYILLSLAYSLWLKKIAYLDILALAAGFLLRIFAGTTALGIPPTKWILACSFSLTLFLAFTKRQCDQKILVTADIPLPKTLQNYSPTLLNKFIGFTAITTIGCYFFYSIDQVLKTPLNYKFIYTSPIVALGILRYLYLCYQYPIKSSDIAVNIFRDPILLITILSWLLIVIL